jgi:hypothetical protein
MQNLSTESGSTRHSNNLGKIMEFKKGKCNIYIIGLSYFILCLRFGYWWMYCGIWKDVDVFNGNRIRIYNYGPILIEVSKKL